MVGAYERFDAQIEESLDLGKGIGLAVVNQKGRPAGSSFEARMRYAAVSAWVEDLLVRITMYTDIDAARAAAERLAAERGWPMSENAEQARASWEFFNRTRQIDASMLHPDIVWHTREDLPDARPYYGR
jgi:hypothetical protein